MAAWVFAVAAAISAPTPPTSRLKALGATAAAATYFGGAASAAASDGAADGGAMIYFDLIAIANRRAVGGEAYKGTPLGRLVFRLRGAGSLPKHTANVRMLCTGERTGAPAVRLERAETPTGSLDVGVLNVLLPLMDF